MSFNKGIDPTKLLTVHQAAARLQVSTGTLRKWMAEKRIEFVKFSPRGTRLRPDHVDRFIERTQKESKP
ncbi:MAG TPA: helix-turn-helix domain-containing protein [Candidatus Cybelea sp.]|nr:helix-turn-helix domain-containing protein [Candidatus Cybelea sp.]